MGAEGPSVLYISYWGAAEPLGQSLVLPAVLRLADLGVALTLVTFDKPADFALPGRRDAIAAELQKVEEAISSVFSGASAPAEAAPKAGKRRGRKPGRKAKSVAVVIASNGDHTYDLPTLEGMMKIVKRVGKEAAIRLVHLFD